MIAVAQSEDGVRALAVLMPQATDRWAFPARDIVTIDELEKLSGLEFFPDAVEKTLTLRKTKGRTRRG